MCCNHLAKLGLQLELLTLFGEQSLEYFGNSSSQPFSKISLSFQNFRSQKCMVCYQMSAVFSKKNKVNENEQFASFHFLQQQNYSTAVY